MLQRGGPFTLCGLLGVLPLGAVHSWTPIALASGLTLVAAIAVFTVPWERLPAFTELLIPFAYFGAVGLARQAYGGGSKPNTVMLALPVVWFAMYGRRIEIVASLVAMAATISIPVLAIGAPNYPVSQLSGGGVLTLFAGFVALAIRLLIAQRDSLILALHRQTLTDPLTKVANRRAFFAQLDRDMQAATQNGDALSVIVLDIDQFKWTNDTFGHSAGDDVLMQASSAWSQVLRPEGTLARIGGDEFAVIVPQAVVWQADIVRRRLIGAAPAIRASAGAAEWDWNEDAETLVGRADAAMYRAKAASYAASVPAV